MKITYINHSGFLVETRDCYYIFDYYKGELPHLDKEKEVIVFCSHFHKDHFNPQIFGILEDMGMTYQAVLANDIRKRNHLSDLKINEEKYIVYGIVWIGWFCVCGGDRKSVV